MIKLELVATDGDPVVVERTPKAYAPRGLGPAQIRWMQDQGWIDRRIIRTKTHRPDCPHVHNVSAYICSCQEKPK